MKHPRVRALKLAAKVRERLTKSKIRFLVSDVTWEVGFEAGKAISAIPAAKEKMKKYGFFPPYKRLKKEGL